MNTIEEIVTQLKKAKNIAIFCHVRPDGDALGSGFALCLALKKAGKTAYMCCEDVPPDKFMFLPAVGTALTQLPDADLDMFISVDCADISRLGVFSKAFQKFNGTTVNIDHHISNTCYAEYNYVSECPASCEIVTEILKCSGIEIDKEIADFLMLGLITDSGNFSHLDVSPKTYETAAYLRAKGADMHTINYNVFGRQPKERAVLYGRVISKIRFALDDKLAVIVIRAEDMEQVGADKSLTEGFVDFPLTIDGVEVAVSLLEFRKDQFKASLRSKGKVNVNAIALGFGGGGHVLASGCMIAGPLEEVIDKLTYAVYQNL